MNFEKYFEKNREVLQLVYGVFLIVLIPLLIFYNTFFIIKNYNKSIDVSLHRHSLSVGRAILPYIEEKIDNKEITQERIKRLMENNSELLELSVGVKEGDGFKIIASSNNKEIGNEYNNYFYQFAFNQKINDGIARDSLNIQKNNQNVDEERYWEVGMPIVKGGEKIGVLSMKTSSKIIDELTRENRNKSLYLLVIEILVVVLFILLAVRFWDYILLYRKIKELDEMKDEFISIASHELRTPVTGIKGYSSMILDGSFGEVNEKTKNAAKTILSASERLGTLVDDLLNVSRIEQGRMEINMEEQNINETVDSVYHELKIQADEKKLDLKFISNEKAWPKIEIDEEKLKQVLINLIGNSIKYTQKGSIVISNYLKDNKYLAISVKDTGIGMNEEERRRLFQKFYRIKNEDTKKVIGTGLGLWITKQIVELMKGKIFVDSIKGTGSEFTIIFPIIKK